MQIVGVYAIRNIATGRSYIGSTTRMTARWQTHRWALRNGRHFNADLQADWARMGAKSFAFEIVELCAADALTEREAAAIGAAAPQGVYNLYLAATPAGYRHSDENRADVSRRLRGRECSVETRQKMSAWKRTEAQRAKVASALRGKPKAAEHRAAIATSLSGRKIGPQSPETIAKRVAATAATKAAKRATGQ